MKSYKDLIVWQKSVELVTQTYILTTSFPDEEKFGLTSQLKRSVISVPSNIAEGYGRKYTKDYIRFLQIARGSLFESQTQLEIAFRLKFVSQEEAIKINELSLEVEKMLNSLINKLG
ncbi:four helix bundle protein [Flavobacterium sp. ST-75]|uniref:Four helix bundle protein n=1 Tax=Flavobacterium rhizophilum TaxID=3163296 RepID=A0ABW8Y8Q3_9FLAO